MNGDEFLRRLRDEAYHALDTSHHVTDLAGWTPSCLEEEVGRVVARIQEPVRILEIGSHKGRSTAILGRLIHSHPFGGQVVALDTWLGSPEFYTTGLNDDSRGGALKPLFGYPTVFRTFTRNMKALDLHQVVTPFPISSAEGIQVLQFYGLKFHLIYVDASHEATVVMRCLRDARTVLEPRGILCGDDYCDEWPGVMSSVHAYADFEGMILRTRGIFWIMDGLPEAAIP